VLPIAVSIGRVLGRVLGQPLARVVECEGDVLEDLSLALAIAQVKIAPPVTRPSSIFASCLSVLLLGRSGRSRGLLSDLAPC
jgi:hypothetical protein